MLGPKDTSSKTVDVALAVYRRLVLLVAAAVAITMEPDSMRAATGALLFVLLLLDALCATFLFRMLGRTDTDAFQLLARSCSRTKTQGGLAAVADSSEPVTQYRLQADVADAEAKTKGEGERATHWAEAAAGAADGGNGTAGSFGPEDSIDTARDMLQGCCMLKPSIAGDNGTAGDALAELQRACRQTLPRLATLPPETVGEICRCLQEYSPSADGSAETTLLEQLSRADDGVGVGQLSLHDAPAAPDFSHPMRAVPLQVALDARRWRDADPNNSNKYELSVDQDVADWIVSHSPRDDDSSKVTMLRDFLCLHDVVGQLVVTLVLLAVFLCPLGFAIESQRPSFPWWVPSAVPLALLLLALTWLQLSIAGWLPPGAAPWSFSPQTLWLDVFCVDRSTPATSLADLRDFDSFLASCNGMVAFASERYFASLWCVYELAVFCRLHEGELKRRLRLLSFEWPSAWNLCQNDSLTEAERGWLLHFECEQAQCDRPADRALVLASIRKDWGSTVAFDEFVQNELVEVLAESKRAHRGRVAFIVQESLEALFGA